MYRVAVLLLALILGRIVPLYADEVFLVNGDRLTGKIEQLVDGKLTISTDLLGEVVVDIQKVQTLSTATPLEIHFHDELIAEGYPVLAAGIFDHDDILPRKSEPVPDDTEHLPRRGECFQPHQLVMVELPLFQLGEVAFFHV